MFAVIGKGQFSKDALVDFLAKLGLVEPYPVVNEIERRGSATVNDMRIMYVR